LKINLKFLKTLFSKIFNASFLFIMFIYFTECKKDTETPLPSLTKPLISTTTMSAITATTAISGGNVTSDGGAIVTTRGVCWSTSANPTISNSRTIDGTGTGVFTSSITELSRNTTYYVRAYATNNVGTSYGNEIIFKTELVSIGESYQGGKVAYILQPKDIGYISGETHGLIVASSDQGTNILWNNGSNFTTGATGFEIGTGNANTNTIVAAQGSGSYAAKLCYDLVLNGYSDWYLPSVNELGKLYVNRAAIGVFASIPYWSSTEVNSYSAYTTSFSGQGTAYYPKSQPLWVRAVRSF
jgi:hypothetical protein